MNTEEKIIQSAIKIFVQEGFSAPTAHITWDAGVSNGVLFRYFATKDELIKQLYIRCIDEFYESCKNQLNHIYMKQEDGSYVFDLPAWEQAWRKHIQWALDNPYKFDYIRMFENTPFMKSLDQDELRLSSKVAEFFLPQTYASFVGHEFKDLPVDFIIDNMIALISSTLSYLRQHPEEAQNDEFMQSAFLILVNACWKTPITDLNSAV